MASGHGLDALRHHHRNASLPQFELELEPDEQLDGRIYTTHQLLVELLTAAETPSSEEQRRLFYDAREAHALALRPSGEVSLQTFAQILALRGHLVWLRTGRPDCGCGQVALRHTFVLAGVAGCAVDPMPALFVVDPSFRDSFQLPNAPRAYTMLWEALPALFVGTAEQLVPIVELMCAEMQRVFADTASSCPPWRTAACMLTKWLPSAADDVPVVAHPAGPSDTSDASTRSSRTNSSMSSPAAGAHPQGGLDGGGLFGIAGVALLAPIRTGGAAAADDAGLTPHSSRVPVSPLYYEHTEQQQELALRAGSASGFKAAAVGLLSPGASDTDALDRRALLQAHYPPVGARDAPRAGRAGGGDQRFGGNDQCGSFGGGAASSGSYRRRTSSDGFYGCFAGAAGAAALMGSWGYASASSSPGVELPGGLLRSCFSEDGSGQRRGVAIAPRGRRGEGSTTAAAGLSGGFGEAFAGRMADKAARYSPPDTGLAISLAACRDDKGAGAAAAAPAADASSERLAHLLANNATLDISRFDRSAGDAAPPLPVFGLGGERGLQGLGALCSSQAGGGSGKLPPPVVRRTSSTSSQASALSAAIAGRDVPARR